MALMGDEAHRPVVAIPMPPTPKSDGWLAACQRTVFSRTLLLQSSPQSLNRQSDPIQELISSKCIERWSKKASPESPFRLCTRFSADS